MFNGRGKIVENKRSFNCVKVEVKCSAGKYLPKNSKTCSSCLESYYCPGDTFTFNTSENQGLFKCPSPYSKSNGMSTSANDCYYMDSWNNLPLETSERPIPSTCSSYTEKDNRPDCSRVEVHPNTSNIIFGEKETCGSCYGSYPNVPDFQKQACIHSETKYCKRPPMKRKKVGTIDEICSGYESCKQSLCQNASTSCSPGATCDGGMCCFGYDVYTCSR